MAGNENSGRKPLDKEKLLVASLAREHTETAIKQLAMLATNADSDSAKIAACTALLDRGWGKPMQATENKHEGAVTINWPVAPTMLDK